MCKKSPRCEPVYIYETNNKLRQKSPTCVPIPSVQQLWLLGNVAGLDNVSLGCYMFPRSYCSYYIQHGHKMPRYVKQYNFFFTATVVTCNFLLKRSTVNFGKGGYLTIQLFLQQQQGGVTFVKQKRALGNSPCDFLSDMSGV